METASALLLTGTTIGFVAGVVILGLLDMAAGRIDPAQPLLRRSAQTLLHGAGFLMCIPFVTSILVRTGTSVVTMMLVGGALFVVAAALFVWGTALFVMHEGRSRAHA